uniref:Ribosomal protein S10 n=11 Tax=Saccharina TaxID=309357 RepID=F8UWN9_9PHAE|nr:ribosomal protein S10 [Saccharina japonica]YP_003288961.1 ribosomal protein S10 [Saccharina religiosa]YP_003288999.1 ribosomal protein S10 [Saccharina ochotensis]YP_003289076.1 ribosomal protein S10 [Saccharina diabolica]YP_003289127.1 ribosomal protein S10 [Saccharina longipedalis]YP_004599023.1 ribosomal protein S10 [Saccharina japonica x Saccharina latissima]YP_008145638.1 ribosomal protein S10 [Saccharina longissima]YP_009176278.1 ribosomal protein S10 [Saccharina sp. ye-B]AIZ57637.1
MAQYKKSIIYICKVWSVSTDFKSLNSLALLLPLSISSTGLSRKIKRFTLLRSPLGNKAAKDQFERREYRRYFIITSQSPATILAFIDILKYLNGVKFKVVLQEKNFTTYN